MGQASLSPLDARAHREGALICLQALAAELDAPQRAALRGLFDFEPPAGQDSGLKYDFYRAVAPGARGWGLTVNDRYEGPAFRRRVADYVARQGQHYDLQSTWRLAEALDAPRAVLTFAVGFDRPGVPPRLKLYFQEEPWGSGLCRLGELGRLCRLLDLAPQLPGWLDPERDLSVITLELLPDGQRALKLYLGAPTPSDMEGFAPPEARALCRGMAAASPLSPAYYYLTLRLGPGAPRCAANKIYEAVRLAQDPGARRAAWHDVAGLFELVRAESELASLLQQLKSLSGLRCVPTATALEGRLDRADVYFTAWRR